MSFIGYVIRSLVKRGTRNVVLLVGLLALSSGLSTYVSANQNARVRVTSTVDQHWRGAYDLLIRPANATQQTERAYGLVESNYLSVGQTGISVQQWKQIEGLPGVEIAAPVSTIGYLRSIAGNMGVSIPPPAEPELLRISVEVSSTNGYQSETLVSQNQYYQLKPGDGLGNMVFTTSPSFAEGDIPGSLDAPVLSPPIMWTLVAGVDPAAERRLAGLDQAIVRGGYLEDNDGFTTEKVPERGSPEDFAQQQSGMHRETVINRVVNPDGPNIPIIFAASTYMSLPTVIEVDRLESLDEVGIQQALQARGVEYGPGTTPEELQEALRQYMDALNQPLVQRLAEFPLDYGEIIQPLSFHALNIDLRRPQPAIQVVQGLSPIGADNSFGITFDGGFDKMYRPGAITYEARQPAFDTGGLLSLSAVPKPEAQAIITMTKETAFRSLPSAPAAMAPERREEYANRLWSPFSFKEVGSYDLDKLPEEIRNPDPLTYVPLGIYQPPLVTLVRDAQGNPLPQGPITLRPTLNPASFIPGPPLALTNIAAARFFRGDNCIDAIRVRVAGIDRYTPENLRKVEQVAEQIIKATGLHVDIVAGSSPQKVLVYIPGSADGTVPPLGYVEEQWTTLGAAAAITSGIDRASMLMLGATGLSGLLYLISQSLLSMLSRRRELALLQAIGWRNRHVGALIVGEAAVLGLLGGLCAVLLAFLVAQSLGLSAPPTQAALVGLAVFLLYLLASLGPALWIVRQPTIEWLQRGEVVLPTGKDLARSQGRWPRLQLNLRRLVAGRHGNTKAGGLNGMGGLLTFAGRNLARRRVRALLAVGNVFIATTLMMLLAAAIAALNGTLNVTLLGQFVGLQVQSYHFIMVGSALAVSILTVADHLAVGVLERRHELALLQAVGWRQGTVRLTILLEGILIGTVGAGAGAIFALAVGLASQGDSFMMAWWVVPLVFVVMLLLCGLTSIHAMLLSRRPDLINAVQQ
ncbi:MAG: FtsX-like permease family protein [Chloroflexota bacterium]|nr:FtsX-like permease family protein [Chloroflexota bacterium]